MRHQYSAVGSRSSAFGSKCSAFYFGLMTATIAVSLTWSASASASAHAACTTLQRNGAVSVEVCNEAKLVRIELPKVAINAVYLAGVSKTRPHWDRLWIVGNGQKLGVRDQMALREVLREPTRELRDSGVVPLLDVMANLIVAGERIEPFERKPVRTQGYSMICEFVNQEKTGYYNRNGQDFQETVMVGVPESGCYGRCGAGCGRDNQYTQECLNHDVCYRLTGQNLGVCADEFWAAADGYVSAPNCF